MSENPLQFFFKTVSNVSNCVQAHLSQFTSFPNGANHSITLSSRSTSPSTSERTNHIDTIVIRPSEELVKKEKASGPVTKEELGRATWTFLHTLAAQYPEKPTRQQKKDVKELMAILSRMYPCQECADHFKEVLRANPVQAGSQSEFAQWLCHTHNVVNRSLGKLVFPCERVDARWGKLECEQRACDLRGQNNPWD
ncbi:OLC1v1002938C1 [Oldenlandia corymbosa var. corymbosa]|uniref:Sulfhydryl oxidase n=1 Tax=Oldenlandia corymbosa var. corymbosa TaxID=529605 RepID=A0AAV1DBT1_OLDCO|nr:OLC1v1002938C1 [Oldenlandia corymbosa var. corymbosa]